MKMKHVMAALLFGVVAVGAAQAAKETHWEYTGPWWGGYYEKHYDIPGACNELVRNERKLSGGVDTTWTGEYEYFLYSTPRTWGVKCMVVNSHYRTYLSFSFHCDNGGIWLPERPDGCYKEVEGPIIDPCDPKLYPPNKLPEACSTPEPEPEKEIDPETGYPKNNALCDGKDYGDTNGVACQGDIKVPCFWAKLRDLEKAFPNKTARDIIYQCVTEHEQFHIDDKEGAICKENGRLGGITEYDKHRREADAYAKSEECFRREITQCGDDPVCNDIIGGVDGRIDHSRKWKNSENSAIGR